MCQTKAQNRFAIKRLKVKVVLISGEKKDILFLIISISVVLLTYALLSSQLHGVQQLCPDVRMNTTVRKLKLHVQSNFHLPSKYAWSWR